MAEYINRGTIIEILNERNRNTCNGSVSCIQMKRIIEAIPTADVIEVVRCKECRMATEDIMIDGYFHCDNNGQAHRADHYCSYGEKRGEGE